MGKKRKLTESTDVPISAKALAKIVDPILRVNANLFNSFSQGIYFQDSNGIVLYANSAVEQIFGVPLEKIIGFTPKHLFEKAIDEDKALVTFDDLPCKRAIKDGLETKNKLLGVFNQKYNKYRWVLVNATPTCFERETGQAFCLFTDVTELHEAKSATKKSETQFHNIIEKSPMGIHRYVLNQAGELIFIGGNPAADAMLGIDHKELLGKKILEAFPGVKDTEIPKFYKEVCETGRSWVQEQVNYKDNRISGAFEVQAFQDSPGRVTVFFVEVTQRKRAEQAIKDSEEKFRGIFDNVNDGILLADVETKNFVTANPKILEMLGYSLDEIKKLSVFDIHPKASLPNALKKFAEQAEKKIRLAENLPVLRKDGSIFFVDISTSPITMGERKYLIGVFRDITDRKESETLLHKQKMAMEQSFDGMVILDLDFHLEYVNPAFAKMHGYEPEELLGQKVFILQNEVQHGKSMADFNREVLEFGHCEKRIIRKRRDGTVFYALLSANLIRNSHGEKIGMIGVMHDVTEEEKLMERLRQSQKMEAIGHLAGGIAHDFNNLLLPIFGYTELLKKSLPPADERMKKLDHIHRAAEKAKDLVIQLLAFSKKQILQPRTISLNPLIEEFERMIHRILRENIKIELHLCPDLKPINGDTVMMEQILINLLLNAQDAISEAGVITIETSNIELDRSNASVSPDLSPGPYCALIVSDSGSGMDEKTMAHIFEPFFSTKQHGSGLGLATTYAIVKQHNGAITVYSEPEKGTTFKIYLPQSNAGLSNEVKLALQEPSIHGNEKILIVEDNSLVRELTSSILTELGYDVRVAGTPRESLEILKNSNFNPDLLLTDLVLPEMNGRELFAEMEKLVQNLKVVYMSGYTDNIIVHQGILENGVQFIQKPFSVQDLGQKIRKALNKLV